MPTLVVCPAGNGDASTARFAMPADRSSGPTVLFLVPDIHALQTGGNVYNRRMIEGLRPHTDVRVRPWTPDETPAGALDCAGADVIVIDSLLAQHPEAVRALRAACPGGTLVLLTHYLTCVDPYTAAPSAAADEQTALAEMDGAITTSQYVRQALVDEGLSAERVAAVRPGLQARYRGALSLRLGRRAPRLLTVANLLPTKGLRAFVDVLSRLRGLPWTWHLVGNRSLDAEYATEVRRRLRAAGLAGRVVWTGVVAPEVLRSWYDRADLFVLPSRFETCSLSTREAMARGLPVVGYRVGGLPENFGESRAGALAPPGNDRALAAALRTLLADPLARRRRGRAAWRRSQSFPTWGRAAQRLRKTLRALHARTVQAS